MSHTEDAPKSLDATWLFEQPGHKSESWWTALFSVLLIELGGQGRSVGLPLWRFARNGTQWRFDPTGSSLVVSDLSWAQVLVEASLNSELFAGVSWPSEFICSPDLVAHWPDARRVIFVENKTKGASVGKLELYLEAAEYLRRSGWHASVLLLISCGHPDNAIWDVVTRRGVEMILWEDVLRLLDASGLSRSIFGGGLAPYYASLRLEGKA